MRAQLSPPLCVLSPADQNGRARSTAPATGPHPPVSRARVSPQPSPFLSMPAWLSALSRVWPVTPPPSRLAQSSSFPSRDTSPGSSAHGPFPLRRPRSAQLLGPHHAPRFRPRHASVTANAGPPRQSRLPPLPPPHSRNRPQSPAVIPAALPS